MGQNETTTNELLLRIKEKYKKMFSECFRNNKKD